MLYEDQTPEAIEARVLARIGARMDTREGSFARDIAAPVCTELAGFYQSLNAVVPIAFVDETSGEYLERRAGEFGLTRKPGTRARAALYFKGTAGVKLSAGTSFFTADGLEFLLERTVLLTGRDDTGTAEAAEPGAAYNTGEGAICRMARTAPGLASFTSGAAAGGTDPEAPAALLERLNLRRQKPAASGNPWHYIQWALEVNGVGAAKVLPLWDGPGTVKVLIVDGRRRPAAAEIVSAAAAHIEDERPIGAEVTVESAQGAPLSFAAEVTLEEGCTAEAARAAWQANLEAWLREISFEQYTVSYNRAAYLLLAVEGVQDFSQLTLNGGTESLHLEGHQVPVLEGVAVT